MSSNNKVIAVFSPSGGAGVTTIAVHTAYLLAGKTQTALLDLVLDFGGVSDFLGFAPKYRIDQIPVSSVEDGSTLMADLSLPSRQALKVFAAPAVPAQEFDLRALIESCRRCFQYTVLDLPHTLLVEDVEIALDQADYILVIGQYSWSQIAQLVTFLEIGSKSRRRRNWSQKCKVVINQVEWLPKDVLDECHANIKVPIFATLSMNTGVYGRHEIIPAGRALFHELKELAQKIEMLP
jgi:MinD-like ATPase involved in chromosome partitioning or flagellar assembly